MSETELRNADIDTALTEAKEAYVARNPKSFARFVEATAVMPGGNTRTVLHYAPLPDRHRRAARAAACGTWTAPNTSTSSANTPPASTATRIRRSARRWIARWTPASTSAAPT